MECFKLCAPGNFLTHRGLRKLSSRSLGLFGFVTCLHRYIPLSKAYADLLQEIIWRGSTREDPDEVVWNLLPDTLYIENDRIYFEFHWIRLKKYLNFSVAHAVFNSLYVSLLDPAKPLSSVAKRYLIAGLMCESHGGLDRAVAPADHENLLVDVMIGLN